MNGGHEGKKEGKEIYQGPEGDGWVDGWMEGWGVREVLETMPDAYLLN